MSQTQTATPPAHSPSPGDHPFPPAPAPGGGGRAMAWIAAAALAVSFAGGVWWALHHPFGTGWDETAYIIRCIEDRRSFFDGGPIALAETIMREDSLRPPLHRVLVLPFTIPLGVSPAVLRLASAGYAAVAFAFFFLAGRRLIPDRRAGAAAGAMLVALAAATPQVISPSFRFGTEYGLILGVAVTLYFLARLWTAPTPSRADWIGLGVGGAIAAWAKISAAPVLGPLLLLAMLALWWRRRDRAIPLAFIKAGVVAAVLAAPWYVFHLDEALAYSSYASSFARHELDSRWDYPELVITGVVGEPLTVLVIAMLGFAASRWRTIWSEPSRRHVAAFALLLLLAPLPLAALHVMGHNHNPRMLNPALPLFFAGCVTLAVLAGWRGRAAWTVTALLLAAQLTWSVLPIIPRAERTPDDRWVDYHKRPAFFTYPQWDWEALYALLHERFPDRPSLLYLGMSQAYNDPQIEMPWARRGQDVLVGGMWRYDVGKPFDPAARLEHAAKADAVLTAPGLLGDLHDRNHLDNAHNAEFEQVLADSGLFETPIELSMGQEQQPVHVWVRRDR